MIHQIHFVITLTASSIRDQEMQPTRKFVVPPQLWWTRINPYSQVKQPKRHYSTPWRTLYKKRISILAWMSTRTATQCAVSNQAWNQRL